MTTLLIKDLSAAAHLDAKAMSAVSGGAAAYPAMPSFVMPSFGPSLSLTKNDFNFTATQGMSQSQNTLVNNGNNVAFASGITSNVNPSQAGSNNISLA
ncbi:hypothetical protein [Noviherbaspirillum galbum]|uniref:Uncharacterized protein n=1 Tax=Noviherbaspirillum galbum TaxID=2709383 RepID=A0A6B3SHQ4_9BURK|nr:hypothetical protein [Noviherbaspirillum galbum]NEX60193.1 hypothetical protein [Noviherbaspirillum galbum]